MCVPIPDQTAVARHKTDGRPAGGPELLPLAWGLSHRYLLG